MFRRTDKVPCPPPAYLDVNVVVVVSDDNYAVADINGKSVRITDFFCNLS